MQVSNAHYRSSVAEIAEKPLYRVTCGDLGTTATTVERYMQTVLYLGKAWDCGTCADIAYLKIVH